MIDPNEIAVALWSQSTDRKLYATWADVPANVKEVWRGSYDAFAGALNRAGYTVTSISAINQFRAQARREEVAEAVMQERKACARVASLFSIDETPIHPDISWADMSERTQMVVHTTCQQVANAILDRAVLAGKKEDVS